MATVVKRLVSYSWQCPRRIAPRYTPTSAIPWQRPFSSTIRPFKDDKSDLREEWKELIEDLQEMDPETFKNAIESGGGMEIDKDDMDLEELSEFDIEPPEPKQKIGFWGDGEEELGADEDYYGDDISALGHGELEQHRELREYARLAAWELPLLSKLAKPFEPPSKATPLRFRYTTYLGENHPAAKKVVVEFCASDMPNLTPQQKDKLIKLAGVRYNPSTDIVKMSCEMFETQAQNKRYLADTINNLLAEARDEKDTFADVPFDFRHHKPKVRHEFPKEWFLTPARKQYLETKRQQQLEKDAALETKGKLIHGAKIIEEALVNQLAAMPVPELVEVAPTRGRGKQRLR
ncbi:hypothetical protein K432DRAFT_429715 [Lepidopterella palustris CBS 459.81]|uniref:Small ribosomal subunit protein mS35 mitochondrial conserved domain-containing protein n=1 Tax=Lepidopterella palustris CBS 459.81 TaxID=1314670 RepID=A0A8E2E0G0_9PEZI|nr:hypothetical protein K432DRAFT_429715 [Lepidopterella palustris CBS 459.81]